MPSSIASSAPCDAAGRWSAWRSTSLAPVQEFLRKHPVGFAIGLAGIAGTDLARSLGNQRGALPFTVLLDAKGKVVQRKLGETQLRRAGKPGPSSSELPSIRQPSGAHLPLMSSKSCLS